jgi:Zn-dependent M28 family amino/carboxypeptidase
MHSRHLRPISLLIVALLISLVLALPATAAVPVDSSALRDAVTVEGISTHLEAFQTIADANGGTRASGTPGYDASVTYVAQQLEAAGYQVTIQPFDFEYEEVREASLEQVAPTAESFTLFEDFFIATGSANATVQAPVQAVDVLLPPTGGSTSGCEAADFAGFTPGNIALIQRGTCFFHDKVVNAQNAGASGVIIFNEGNAPDRMDVLFPDASGATPLTIPVLGISFAQGQAFYDLIDDGLVLRIGVDIFREIRPTANVIAETPTGRDDRVVVVGAHLDSVVEGPGINDNGSGSATILEIAIQMAELGIQPRNTVRFAFWGAEESGLLGAEYYVSQLTKRQIKDIAVNLNFDMVGSVNFVRFVYDGDGDGTGTSGPNGSDVVEDVFLDYFDSQGLPTEPTAFDGRSDYGPFIAVGIPAGGLFTGAEGIKTPEQAAIYGGTAGIAYDPCYHQACDTLDNISDTALDQMADATAHATLTFAMTTSAVNGTDKGAANGHSGDLEFRGHRAIR